LKDKKQRTLTALARGTKWPRLMSEFQDKCSKLNSKRWREQRQVKPEGTFAKLEEGVLRGWS
jgi:hypothetical protein